MLLQFFGCMYSAELCNETVQLTYKQMDMRMVIMFCVLVKLYCNMSMEGSETNTCCIKLFTGWRVPLIWDRENARYRLRCCIPATATALANMRHVLAVLRKNIWHWLYPGYGRNGNLTAKRVFISILNIWRNRKCTKWNHVLNIIGSFFYSSYHLSCREGGFLLLCFGEGATCRISVWSCRGSHSTIQLHFLLRCISEHLAWFRAILVAFFQICII
jgi:hypothetical protein